MDGENQPIESEETQQTSTDNSFDEVNDLSAAFKKFNEIKSEGTQDNVAEPEAVEDEDDEPVQQTADILDEPTGEPGGLTDVDEEVDYSTPRKQLDDNIKRAAITTAEKEFEKMGIKKLKLQDLYWKDERSGEVAFINPDKGERGAKMNRNEAKQFIRDWNEDIDNEMREAARKYYRQYSEAYAPTMRLYEFAPTYNKMDAGKKEVFDNIISPYAVKDSSGAVIGFSCDLNAASKQADTIINSVRSRYAVQQEKPKEPVTRPTTDIKTSGVSQPDEPSEPSNIAEAMKMYQKQKGKK